LVNGELQQWRKQDQTNQPNQRVRQALQSW